MPGRKSSFEAERTDYPDENTISRIIRFLRDGDYRFEQRVKKGILLFGSVGVGKSTLAYVLSGRKLKVQEHAETNELVIDAIEPQADIIIQHASSDTKVLSKCLAEDIVIWEFPDLDNSKPVEEIASIFYIRKVFEAMEQLKFVLVVSGSDLTERKGCGFVETLSNFIRMFKDITCLNGSVSLVVTKISKRKNVHHVRKAIEEILICNQGVTSVHKALTSEMLSAIYLFPEPSEDDDIEIPDLLTSIGSLGAYTVTNKDNVATNISETGETFASHLLKISCNNFYHVLEIIEKAISDVNNCSSNGSNVFFECSFLIEAWVPMSLCYNCHQEVKSEYFLELELLTKLLHVIPNYDVLNVSEAILVFQQVLETFSEYADPSNRFFIQGYAYCLQQQHEHVIFFSNLCEVEQLDCNKVFKILKVCHEKAQENLDFAVFNLCIDKNVVNESYYLRAITFLEDYQKIPACLKKMAAAYWYLGSVTRQSDKCSALAHFMRSAKIYSTAMWKTFRQFLCHCEPNYRDL